MKTILYQPIFINPQAYFVFPQLYHIEKGDSYIEPANISYQTKTSYNGNAINYHNDQYDNDDRLIIGSTKDILGNQCFIGCHGDILLFNRTLTDDELDLVKEHFFGIVRIKDAILTTDKKYLALTNNNYIKLYQSQ